jgi:ABC-type phosphate transport system permease subunit
MMRSVTGEAHMKRSIVRGISAIVAAVLSGAYWFGFFLFAEAFTAADYRADMQPGDGYLTAKVALAVIIGPLIYALLLLAWRRIDQSLVER